MKAFAALAVTAGLIIAIPVANAQTWARTDAAKSPHHAASHSNRPYFGMPLQTMLRHLLRQPASMRHVASHGRLPPKPTTVAAGPTEPAAAAPAKTADAASGRPSESTGTAGEANPPTPQILPTEDMPAVQGLE